MVQSAKLVKIGLIHKPGSLSEQFEMVYVDLGDIALDGVAVFPHTVAQLSSTYSRVPFLMYFSANSAALSHIMILCHSVRSGVRVPSAMTCPRSVVASEKVAMGRVSM